MKTSKRYNVYLKAVSGPSYVLTSRNRTYWAYKTAKKHMLDCVSAKINKGMFPDVEYFAVLECLK